MIRSMMLIWLFLFVLSGSLFSNEMTESERLKMIEDTKQYVGIPALDKDSWLSHQIENKIQQNQELSNSLIQQLYHIVVRNEEIDIRELNMVLKFLKYGDNDAKKTAVDILPKSIEKNLSIIKDMDYNYFYDLIKPLVNSQYSALVTESCISLYKISTILEHTFDDTLLLKLEYYAKGTDSENWNLNYNPDSVSIKRICEEMGYEKEEYAKERAINVIRRNAIRNLFLMNKDRVNKALIEIMNHEKEPKFPDETFKIKNMIKKLFEYKERGSVEYNFQSDRDPNWNGTLSAAYCEQWAESYNTAQYPHNYPEDCANFGSQCLIAGGLDLSDYNGSQYVDGYGSIPSAPNLHTYLSSRPDVKSEVLNIWSHQSWNPNEHIPDWFTTGDIAILGIYNISPAIHTIINHEGSGSSARFGAHTVGVKDSLLSHWIKPPYSGIRYDFDYVTFFHISDSLYAGTQIPAGNINGTWSEENSPYYINGDITVQSGNLLTIEPGTYIEFTGNYNLKVYGQLISSGSESELITFTAQDTVNGWGGIRFYQTSATSEFEHTTFQYAKNFSQDHYFDYAGYPLWGAGSAIFAFQSPLNFTNCIFRNCSSYNGGAMYLMNQSNATITNCEFYQNSAGESGGAIAVFNSPLFDYPTSSLSLIETLIHNNTAGMYGGGALHCTRSVTVEIVNCTMTENFAQNNWGEMISGSSLFFREGCYTTMYNTILWGNQFPEIVLSDGSFSSNFGTIHSDITGGSTSFEIHTYGSATGNVFFGNTIIDEDPEFVDSTNHDYTLNWYSPCIDGGTDSVLRFNENSKTYEIVKNRNYDPDGTLPDMGTFYYYQPDYVQTPTNLNVTSVDNTTELNWTHGDGAIFYEVYSSENPFSGFTLDESGEFNQTNWLAPTNGNSKFYYVIGKNNRTRNRNYSSK